MSFSTARASTEPHRGGLVMGLGIAGIAIVVLFSLLSFAHWAALFPGTVGMVLGIVAWVMGKNDLAKMKLGTMDGSGYTQTQAGYICGMIATLLQVTALLCAGILLAGLLAMMRNKGQPSIRSELNRPPTVQVAVA